MIERQRRRRHGDLVRQRRPDLRRPRRALGEAFGACRRSCAGSGARTRRFFSARAPTARSGCGACASCSNACRAASSATAARSPAWPRYSRDCLRALRAQPGIRYDHLERGILQFATNGTISKRSRATPRRCARSASNARGEVAPRSASRSSPRCEIRAIASPAGSTPERRVGRCASLHRGACAARRRAAACGFASTVRYRAIADVASDAGDAVCLVDDVTLQEPMRTWSRSEATARLLLAPLGISHPGLSAEGLLDHAAARTRARPPPRRR